MIRGLSDMFKAELNRISDPDCHSLRLHQPRVDRLPLPQVRMPPPQPSLWQRQAIQTVRAVTDFCFPRHKLEVCNRAIKQVCGKMRAVRFIVDAGSQPRASIVLDDGPEHSVNNANGSSAVDESVQQLQRVLITLLQVTSFVNSTESDTTRITDSAAAVCEFAAVFTCRDQSFNGYRRPQSNTG